MSLPILAVAHWAGGATAGACSFNGTDEQMSMTPGGSDTSDRTRFTWDFWIRLPAIGTREYVHTFDNGTSHEVLFIESTGAIQIFGFTAPATTLHSVISTSLLLTANVWWNVHIEFDTNLSSGDRIRFWVNGSATTSGGSAPTGTTNHFGLGAVAQAIARQANGSDFGAFDLARFYHIDGSIVSVSQFGVDDGGTWKALSPTPTFGSTGFFLPMSDAADLGNDALNGLDFSLVDIDASNSLGDGPPLA